MDILNELKQERDRINAAIQALSGGAADNGRRGRRRGRAIRTVPTIVRRRLSAAARKKISQAAKARWAKTKKAGKTSL